MEILFFEKMDNHEFKEQDEYLSEMTGIATRLKGQIDNINCEVNSQVTTMTAIDKRLEKTQNNMHTINGQLENMKDAIGK